MVGATSSGSDVNVISPPSPSANATTSSGALPFGSSRMVYPKPPSHSIPPHQSFVLQKRGMQSIYGSETANPPTAAGAVQRPFTKFNPKFPHTVPAPMPFKGESVQSSSLREVEVNAATRDFFSTKRVADHAEQQAKDAQEGHRRVEGREVAQRGREGTPGLQTLRHADAIAATREDAAPAPQPESYTTTAAQRRPLGVGRPNPYERILRFQAPMQSTSHAQFQDPKDVDMPSPKGVKEDNGKWGQAAGYMGHVPRDPRTRAKIKGTNDVFRGHTKDNLLITSHLNLPGYTGHAPTAVVNDRGVPMQPDLMKTTAGSGMKYAAEHPDRARTSREHAKSHAMKNFFSRGHTGEDIAATESYYSHFRPYAGYMKHGTKGEQGWLVATAR